MESNRAMLIKRAVIESGDWGAILHEEIARLTDELTAKEAAVTVLIGEKEKLEADLSVEREHRERLSYMMAEAGK